MGIVEGYISKATVVKWLEDYEYMVAGEAPPDAPPGNSGPKAYDGVSAAKLNKIMLDQAIDRLSPLKKNVIVCRYVRKLPRKEALKRLGISESVYYNRLKLAIDEMYSSLNGVKADQVRVEGNHRALFDKIIDKA